MRHYMFPFDKVKKDERVVIYGVGRVGKEIISQAKAVGINVVFTIDAYSQLIQKQMPNVDVLLPSELKVRETEYDKVIIAMADENVSNDVYEILIQMGVVESKIIRKVDYYDDVISLETPHVKEQRKYTFSWFGEDLVVKGLFQMLGISKPTYLDVGCNHPYEGSNTALLYLTGSRGVNIDANYKCIELMNAERPEDKNLCLGVLDEPGEFDFIIVGELSGLNTFSKEYLDAYNDSQSAGEKVQNMRKVQCKTLETIISEYCGGVFPDFFDLDVEGMDEAVMHSYDFSVNGPKVICVETHDASVVSQMLNQGYIRYFETLHNSIFIRREFVDRVIIQ